MSKSCCFQAPWQRFWGFRPPILRLLVIFFRFFSFIGTTNQKLGNAADAYWKKGGWLVCHTEFHNNNIYSNSIIVYHPLNRPFPSSPRPLYQNEVRCSTFDKEWFFILLQIKLISTRKVVHLSYFESEGFWNSEVAYWKVSLGTVTWILE